MKTLEGHFLVASRSLRDPNFLRTVVLMIEHDEEGSFGIVLNRPSGKTIQHVWEMIEQGPCECDDMVYVGGPVPGPIVAIHQREELAERTILPNLFASTDKELVQQIVEENQPPFRLFSGHAGWGADQLEDELKVGGWISEPASDADIFGDHEKLWKKVTNRIGLSIVAPGFDKSKIPDDPSVN